jgi:preprotein translocase subunit YajC
MGGGASNIIFFGALFAIMYFVLIRPQQRQAKDQQTMLSALKKGDDVITTGGIIGKIFAVDEKVITLEVSSNVKLRVLKSAVQGKVTVEPAKTADSTEAKKEEK